MVLHNQHVLNSNKHEVSEKGDAELKIYIDNFSSVNVPWSNILFCSGEKIFFESECFGPLM